MAFSYATQLREAVVTDDVAKFQLEMAITDRGDVPDLGFFVMRIVNADDAKQDILERVAEVGDLFTWSTDRPTALIEGQVLYRSASVVKTYTRISDAVTAKDYLVERVNALVVDYQTYDTLFAATPAPETYEFPAVSLGVLEPAIAAYVAKVEEVDAQRELVTEKQEACAELDAAYVQAVAYRDGLQTALTQMQKVQSAYDTAVAAMEVFSTTSDLMAASTVAALEAYDADRAALTPPAEVARLDDVFLADPPGPPGTLWTQYHDSFKGDLVTYKSALTAAQGTSIDLGTAIANHTALVVTAQADVDAALTAKEACAAEAQVMSSVLATLESEQTTLLTTVTDLCPAYTP